MRNIKTLLLLAVVTAIALVAAIFYRPGTIAPVPVNAGLLLPGLSTKLDKIQTVSILHAGENVTLQKQNGLWTIAEKTNYPALEGQVRELLLGLANAQRLEPKTRNPQYYSNLGLTDADKTSGEASKIELKDQSNKSIAQITLGKRHPAANATGRSDFYAMLKDDPQTWLVEGDVPTVGAAGSWLKRTLLELDRTRIVDVILKHNDGETVHVIPKEPGKLGMTLEGLKADETLQNDYALDDIADRFTMMQLEDVRKLDQIKWPDKPDLQVELRTKDGILIKVITAKIDGQSWIQLAASALPVQKPGADTTPHKSNVLTAKDPQESAKTKDAKSVQQEIAELNARWHGWTYTLADWAYQALDKRRASLVKSTVAPTIKATNSELQPVQPTLLNAPPSRSNTKIDTKTDTTKPNTTQADTAKATATVEKDTLNQPIATPESENTLTVPEEVLDEGTLPESEVQAPKPPVTSTPEQLAPPKQTSSIAVQTSVKPNTKVETH